jgi:hypothetical protein
MPPLAWFWTGLLATGTASAACLQWLGPPPRAAVAAMAPPAMAPPAVAPPGVLEVAAVAHATYLPADPTLDAAAVAVAVALPVPPMPPARHPRTPRHVSLAHGAAARWRRPPPPPLRVPELERWRTPYPAPLREGYEYFPAGGYYVWRY